MMCYRHLSNEATATCSECGRGLCQNCANTINPPMCLDCARAINIEVKSEMAKNIVISIVLMIVGMLLIQSPGGALLAGIPYGWAILNRITPSMFLWLSLIGWVVYFLIKLVLAYIIGVPALFYKLICWITKLISIKKTIKCIEEAKR